MEITCTIFGKMVVEDGGRPPLLSDWENTPDFVKFFKCLYYIILKYSISVRSIVYLHEVCSLAADMEDMSLSENYLSGEMAINMK